MFTNSINYLRMYDVVLQSEQIESKWISHYVINQNLSPFTDFIRKSPEYKDFCRGETKVWIGSEGHDCYRSHIHRYLYGHSIRKGIIAKLANCIYKILEYVNELFEKGSDRLSSLNEIEDILIQKHKLETKTYSSKIDLVFMPTIRNVDSKIKKEAEQILLAMLDHYNLLAIT